MMRDPTAIAAIAAMMAAGDYDQYRERPLKPAPISPLTGKQPIGKPSSNRKAVALEKALRRKAREQRS